MNERSAQEEDEYYKDPEKDVWLKKEKGREHLEKMKDYDQYVKQLYKPKVSQKKKEELEMAFKQKRCSFARQDPHLPITGMMKDFNAVSPISKK